MIGRVVAALLLWPVAIGAGASGRRASGAPVELTRSGTRVDVRVGERPFTTYFFDPSVAKPYLFPVRSADGTILTRGFPMTPDIAGEDQDEPHQRAMYFAHGNINGFDFWEKRRLRNGAITRPRHSAEPCSAPWTNCKAGPIAADCAARSTL